VSLDSNGPDASAEPQVRLVEPAAPEIAQVAEAAS
jgi:hypothetical protein